MKLMNRCPSIACWFRGAEATIFANQIKQKMHAVYIGHCVAVSLIASLSALAHFTCMLAFSQGASYHSAASWPMGVSPTVPLPTAALASMARVMARHFCQLQSTCAHSLPAGSFPPRIVTQKISTTLKMEAWQCPYLPTPIEWISCLVEDMQNGFGIGLLPTAACRSSGRNCLSALQHSQVVSEFLQQVAVGYMMGPFNLA